MNKKINKLVKIKKNPSLALRTFFKKILRLIPFSRNYSRAFSEILSKKLLHDNKIRDVRPSLIYSLEGTEISDDLVLIATEAIKRASRIKLGCGKKNLSDSKFLNEFPGEHYRILSSIVNVTNAREVIEIGTYTGLGTLSIKEGFANSGKISTFDLVAWNKLNLDSHFIDEDFRDGSIEQIIGDLSDNNFFEKNFNKLNNANIIFMDAPKDDNFEYKMMRLFVKLDKKKGKLLILDDIKFVNMIDLWRSVKSPKIDLSSFGHWTGTGVIDISEGLKF